MRCAFITVFAWLFICAAHADEYRPAYLELKQTGNEQIDVLFKVPAKGSSRLNISVELPRDFVVQHRFTPQLINGAYIERSRVTLAGELQGSTIGILGLDKVSSDVLVRVQRLDGSSQTARLNAASTSFTVEAVANVWLVARTYLVFGIEHILTGFDHLIFVACLVFIARTPRRIVLTITGFTLAHSVTLSLAALQLFELPVPPIEAVIALSIVFVARELVLDRRNTLTWKHPLAVSATFGLLHGFGFATALSELGLPTTEVPAALLAFNVGVELGQLLFVSILLTPYWLLMHSLKVTQWATNRSLRNVQRSAGYCVGVIAMFWMLQRTSRFFG